MSSSFGLPPLRGPQPSSYRNRGPDLQFHDGRRFTLAELFAAGTLVRKSATGQNIDAEAELREVEKLLRSRDPEVSFPWDIEQLQRERETGARVWNPFLHGITFGVGGRVHEAALVRDLLGSYKGPGKVYDLFGTTGGSALCLLQNKVIRPDQMVVVEPLNVYRAQAETEIKDLYDGVTILDHQASYLAEHHAGRASLVLASANGISGISADRHQAQFYENAFRLAEPGGKLVTDVRDLRRQFQFNDPTKPSNNLRPGGGPSLMYPGTARIEPVYLSQEFIVWHVSGKDHGGKPFHLFPLNHDTKLQDAIKMIWQAGWRNVCVRPDYGKPTPVVPDKISVLDQYQPCEFAVITAEKPGRDAGYDVFDEKYAGTKELRSGGNLDDMVAALNALAKKK